MKLNILAFAIPVFLLFIIVEYYLVQKKNKKKFHFEETISNINIGIVERISDLFVSALFLLVFDKIQKTIGIFEISNNFFNWVLLFLATDFLWYWYHRFGHEVALGWAVHVVHHQSSDYNFTVSARITIFQALIRGLFWSVLPLLGFKASMITFFLLIHGAYPFFTHTQLIGKLGFLEYFLVTPSHHRVHHSCNEKYLDKNYGDILIIWDKMFSTFVKETEEPVYGLTKPLNSYSFLWQMFHFPLEILVSVKQTKGLMNKLKVLWDKPDKIDPNIRLELENKLSINRNLSSPMGKPLYHYMLINTILVLAVTFVTILFSHYLSAYRLFILSVFIVLSAIHSGAMLEQRRWVFYLDYFRLIAILLLIPSYQTLLWINISIILVIVTLLVYSKIISRFYYRYLFCYN